jgi:hypothetical protein
MGFLQPISNEALPNVLLGGKAVWSTQGRATQDGDRPLEATSPPLVVEETRETFAEQRLSKDPLYWESSPYSTKIGGFRVLF